MRKFETEYDIGSTTEILTSERNFRRDVDLRLDGVETDLADLGSNAQELAARVVRVIDTEIAPRAAEIDALLETYRKGIPAASVNEEPSGRQFLTPDRRAAILAELRGGVDGSGDTLAKLLAMVVALDAAKATPGEIGAAVDSLRGGVDGSGDTLAKLLAKIVALDNAKATPGDVAAAVASLRAGVVSGRDTLKALSDLIDGVSASLATKAPLANAALTGTATAPTVGAVADNSDKISTTAFVQSVVAAKIADLLAHTFNNDPNFATAVAYGLSLKADVSQLASKQNALGFTPVQQGTGVNQNINSVVKIGWGNSAAALTATVDTADFGKIWTDRDAPASIGGSGYMRLPNNMILQWGMFGGGDLVVTFPIAFPNICVGVWAQLVAGLTAGESVSAAVDQISRWQFSKRGRYANAGGAVSSATQPGYYFAIGY